MEILLALGIPIALLVWSYNRPIMGAFFTGVYFYKGLYMFMQDWQGLTIYKKFLDENWIEFHWGVGATLAIIAFAFYTLQLIKHKRNLNEWGTVLTQAKAEIVRLKRLLK